MPGLARITQAREYRTSLSGTLNPISALDQCRNHPRCVPEKAREHHWNCIRICYHAKAMDAVAISRVKKTFGSTAAVDDLSLNVPEGSVYGFIGPNGSGKTT